MRHLILIPALAALLLPTTGAPAGAAPVAPLPDAAAASDSLVHKAKTATVKGKVSKPNGKRLPGVTVLAYPKRGTTIDTEPLAQTTTNLKGKYRLNLPRGRYRVMADGYGKLLSSQWYPRAATHAESEKVRAKGVVKRVSFTLIRPRGDIPLPVLPAARPSSPDFSGLPVDPVSGYEPQKKCRTKPRPGTEALRDLVLATYGEEVPAYMNRECQADTSEHYDGRAVDWMVDVRDRHQASKGDAFVHWLTATRDGEPAAMARRLGVMYLVWRGRIWGQYRLEEGWREYRDCSQSAYKSRDHDNICHRNHIHISLNHDGAEQRTSWYQVGNASAG